MNSRELSLFQARQDSENMLVEFQDIISKQAYSFHPLPIAGHYSQHETNSQHETKLEPGTYSGFIFWSFALYPIVFNVSNLKHNQQSIKVIKIPNVIDSYLGNTLANNPMIISFCKLVSLNELDIIDIVNEYDICKNLIQRFYRLKDCKSKCGKSKAEYDNEQKLIAVERLNERVIQRSEIIKHEIETGVRVPLTSVYTKAQLRNMRENGFPG